MRHISEIDKKINSRTAGSQLTLSFALSTVKRPKRNLQRTETDASPPKWRHCFWEKILKIQEKSANLEKSRAPLETTISKLKSENQKKINSFLKIKWENWGNIFEILKYSGKPGKGLVNYFFFYLHDSTITD